MKSLFFLFLILPLHATTVTLLPQVVLSDTSSGNFNPVIAMNPTGQAVAVWTELILSTSAFTLAATASSIVASIYDPTTQTWLDPTTLGYGSSPVVGIDHAGNSWVVFVASGQLQAAYYTATTSTWDDPIALTSGSDTNTSPQIAMNQHGITAVTWLVYENGSLIPSIDVMCWDGTSWSPATTVNTPAISNYVFVPHVALDDATLLTGPEGVVIWQSCSQTIQPFGQIQGVTFSVTD